MLDARSANQLNINLNSQFHHIHDRVIQKAHYDQLPFLSESDCSSDIETISHDTENSHDDASLYSYLSDQDAEQVIHYQHGRSVISTYIHHAHRRYATADLQQQSLNIHFHVVSYSSSYHVCLLMLHTDAEEIN